MVQINFNAAQVKPQVALEAIPSGIYPVMITKSEEKPTKAGNGSYIEFEMTVMQGHEFAGRKVFDRLNTNNPNPTAVEIAYGTLSAICHVTGRLNMTDTQQLHGIPFMAIVKKIERNDQPGSGNMTNEVAGYKDINGNDPGAAGTPAQPQGQPNWAQNQQTQPVQQTPPAQQVQQTPPPQQPQAEQPAWAQGGTPVQQQQPQQQPAQQTPNPAAGASSPPWLQNQQPQQ